MTQPPTPRRVRAAATPAVAAALAAGAVVTPAVATVPAERAALEARVQAVRQALKAVAGTQHPPSWTVAQATNWTNWPKWSKWSNWANK